MTATDREGVFAHWPNRITMVRFVGALVLFAIFAIWGDVEAEARRTLELDASTVLVKPFTETLHPSPKQVVPIAVDSYSGSDAT